MTDLTLKEIAIGVYVNTVKKYGHASVDPQKMLRSIISTSKLYDLTPSLGEVRALVVDVLREAPTKGPSLREKSYVKAALKAPVNAVMRLAPSPSKSAHMGHVYLMALYKLLLAQPSAQCILRFEDTDTTPGRSPTVQSVMSFALAADWLSLKFSKVYFASSRVLKHLQYLEPHVAPQMYRKAIRGVKATLSLRINGIQKVVFRPGKSTHPLAGNRFSWPIYHVQNVIDDHLDGVNFILRGTDLKPSQPLQSAIKGLLFGKPLVRTEYMGRLRLGTVLKGRNMRRNTYFTGNSRALWRYVRRGLTAERFHNLAKKYEKYLFKRPFTGTPCIQTIVRLKLTPTRLLNLLAELRYSENSRDFCPRFFGAFTPDKAVKLPDGPILVLVHKLFTLEKTYITTIRKKMLLRDTWYSRSGEFFIKINKTVWRVPRTTTNSLSS